MLSQSKLKARHRWFILGKMGVCVFALKGLGQLLIECKNTPEGEDVKAAVSRTNTELRQLKQTLAAYMKSIKNWPHT